MKCLEIKFCIYINFCLIYIEGSKELINLGYEEDFLPDYEETNNSQIKANSSINETSIGSENLINDMNE